MGQQCSGKSSYSQKTNRDERSPGEINPPLHEGHILGIQRLMDNRICSSGSDASIAITDWMNHSSIQLIGHKKAVSRVGQSPKNPNLLFSSSRDLSLKLWNIENQSCIQTILDAHSLNITGLAWSPDGSQICSGSRDYSSKIWDAESGELVREYSTSRNIVTCVTWPQYLDHLNTPLNGNIILQGSEDLCVRGWDVRQSSKQPSIHLTGFQYFPLNLAVHDSQPLLAAGCKGFNGVGCDIKLWDVRYFRPGKFLSELSGHQQDVTCCKFLPSTNSNSTSPGIPMLLSGSRDCTLKSWALDENNSSSTGWKTSFSDRSSYNCLDIWCNERENSGDVDGEAGDLGMERRGSWLCCLGDMDGSLSILSLEQSTTNKMEINLIWKSPSYVPGEYQDEEVAVQE